MSELCQYEKLLITRLLLVRLWIKDAALPRLKALLLLVIGGHQFLADCQIPLWGLPVPPLLQLWVTDPGEPPRLEAHQQRVLGEQITQLLVKTSSIFFSLHPFAKNHDKSQFNIINTVPINYRNHNSTQVATSKPLTICSVMNKFFCP